MVRQAFISSARHVFQQHKIELGSSELHTVSNYKPGETTIIAQGDATGRIIYQDSDKYGRWSYFHLQGQNDTIITYISVYKVCKKPTNAQGIASYHQQETAFRIERRPNANPQHNFREDIIKFIQSQQTRGHMIILAGDFNEYINNNHTNIQHISC
jgi:hypothetical protein